MKRRDFLAWGGKALLGLALLEAGPQPSRAASNRGQEGLRLFLAGDLMTGRGIDQVLPYSVDARLHEPYVKDARTYVELAEAVNGEIPERVDYEYPWGDALEVLDEMGPAARIVNLETAVTTSNDWWPGKAIHYRMHPANAQLLSAAALDVCTLGNNHVVDWGREGLVDTLDSLQREVIAAPGAGRDDAEAAAPVTLEADSGRILVFSYGTPGAGVPTDWRATSQQAGVNFLPSLGPTQREDVIRGIESRRKAGDLVVVSVHWGGNWGYQVPQEQQEFARALIDSGVADVIHGHSSHHPKAIEVYRGRLILYGAGDLLNDYEGIGGHEQFRKELALMYFPELDPSGELRSLEMVPMRIRRFRLERAPSEDARWLAERLDRECRRFGSRVELTGEGRLSLQWDP